MTNKMSIIVAGTFVTFLGFTRFSNEVVLSNDSLINDKLVNNQNDSSGLFTDGGKLNLISKQFSFTEGPAADKQGNIFFTDQPNDKIWKYDTNGILSVFMDKTGRSNGLTFDHKGNLISCADDKNEIWCISPKKKVTVLLKNYKGELFNGPNDVWVDAKGGIYFTDPLYERPYWEKGRKHIAGEKVYYLPKGKNEPVIADETITKPNGIIGTPDGKYLFVADIGAWKTYKFGIASDGSLTNRQLFTEKGSDGMTIDEKGNIYLTGEGVIIFNPEGKQIAHIPVPAKWTANVCFGGKDKKKLFITASESVYTVDMAVRGAD